MRLFHSFARLAATALAAFPAIAHAAPAPPAKEPPSYILSYCLVMLCVGLGMLSVCYITRRRDRARPEQYGE